MSVAKSYDLESELKDGGAAAQGDSVRKTSISFVILSNLILISGVLFAADDSAPTNSRQETYQKEKSAAIKQLQEYMQRLDEDAKREGAMPIEKYGNGFAESVTRSQNLAEDGNYAEAANVLSGLITSKIESDWKGMLEKRIEILNKWVALGTVDLPNYRIFYLETGPEWFHERTKPMVSLWKMNHLPEAGKLFLIAALLDKRLSLHANKDDRQGQLIIAQAIPYLPNVEPKEATAAYLMAGNLLHGLGDLDGAEKHWKEVLRGVIGTPDWFKAVFNLGVLSKEKKLFTQAIEYFQKVLDAKPNDKESSPNIMDPYRNYSHHSAMQISECYEALGDYKNALKYVELAQTQYPYQSFDYNAAADGFIRNRIKTLREKAAKDEK